jgi:hypothetical protein
MKRSPLSSEWVATQLKHVRWIGGGTGAGKSTIARALAPKHHLRLYSCEPISAHVGRSNPRDDPLLHEFLAMDMDERWVNRSPLVMLETFHGYQGEAFDLIIEDLLALPETPPILAEGFRLLPRLVAPLLTRPDQAVWLAPSPTFRRAAFASRGSTWEIAQRTSQPDRALAKILTRDDLFTENVIRETTALHLRLIEFDVGRTIEEIVRLVAECLGLEPGSTTR